MRRLAAIASGLEVVIGPDRDIQLFFPIVVHVAKPQIERPVRVDIEAFVYRGDALTRPMAILHKLIGRHLTPGGLERDGKGCKKQEYFGIGNRSAMAGEILHLWNYNVH